MYQQPKVITQQKMRLKTNNLCFFLLISSLLSLLSFKAKATEPNEIVELPTAGILPKGTFTIQSNFFNNGGMRLRFLLSPFTNFTLGISYSGTNIIGSGEVNFQHLPGVQIKFRFFDERITFPALSIGLSTQGFGNYYKELERFQTYSPGIYLVASKGFKNFFGIFDVSLGINYSLEPKPNRRGINLYGGFSQFIFKYLQLNLEYNSTLDESNKDVMLHKGLLNFSTAFLLKPNVKIELILKDLLKNFRSNTGIERNILIQYSGEF